MPTVASILIAPVRRKLWWPGERGGLGEAPRQLGGRQAERLSVGSVGISFRRAAFAGDEASQK